MGSDNEGDSSGQQGTASVLEQFRSMDIVNYIGVEDFADKLSYKWTSFILSGLCAVVSMKTYFLRPVACFMPSPTGYAMENLYDYVNSYCWTEGTYAVSPVNFSLSAELPDGGLSAYSDAKIVYYQWVPFVLALQAVLFYLPRLLWHSVSYDRAGTDVGHVVRVASDAARAGGERHEMMVNHASRMLDQMLQRSCAKSVRGTDPVRGAWRTTWRQIAVVMPAKLSGSWLILTYLLIKLIYLANVLSQLSLMRKFLGIDSSHYNMLGARLLWDVAHGRDWQITGMFPRVGCCGVYMRASAAGNWQFVQCILVVNMINEKIYTFLWFWFVFVSMATILSLAAWLVRVFRTSCGNHFVDRMLKLSDNYREAKTNEYVRSFCRVFLKRDGTFVLKMIALNCGDVICSEIVQRLWALYREHRGFDHSEYDLRGALTLADGVADAGDESGLRRRGCRQQRRERGPSNSGDAFQNATAPFADDEDELRSGADSCAVVIEGKKP